MDTQDFAPAFWDALAPQLSLIESNDLDARTARRLTNERQEPVLVVGAGQGRFIAEFDIDGTGDC